MRAKHSELRLPVPRLIQPDDVTCGPTSLSAVLRFHGHDKANLQAVIDATPTNPDGGTLAPHLGSAALSFGVRIRAHPLAVRIFDPTWRRLEHREILERLEARTGVLPDGPFRRVHEAWVRYMKTGGDIVLGELRTRELVRPLERGHPLICGLSVTWLYQQARERPLDNMPDDVSGMPVGHFVVITGYADRGRHFYVADPWPHPPFPGDDGTGTYLVPRRRLQQAILLGDATHDAVVLEVVP